MAGSVSAKTARTRFSRTDWLDTGLRQLAAQGPEGLKLQTLCASQKRTTGSFYYHFRDHAAFVDALMDHWQRVHTDDLILAVADITDDADRAAKLNTLTKTLDHRVEVAVRLFAFQHAGVRARLSEIDGKRIAYVADLYTCTASLPPDEAMGVARLEYAALVGAEMLVQSGTVDNMDGVESTFVTLLGNWIEGRGTDGRKD